MSKAVKLLTIKHLLSQDQYLIPVYQRNYAWGSDEIGQLVWDLYKAFEQDKNKAYYLGTLVVYQRADGKYEVIDGQQRLTTLHILNQCLSKFDDSLTLREVQWDEKTMTNLDFESRPESKAQIDNPEIAIKTDSSIACGFDEMWQALMNLKNLNGANIDSFKKFINEQVKICRTIVPKDTDLNHYFEIMNTRGEQLEKHEIIKAQLMGKLDQKDQKAFATIWDACSDMSRFAVSGLPTIIRAEFFVDKLPCRLKQDFDLGKFKGLFIDKKAEGSKPEELEKRKDEIKQDLETCELEDGLSIRDIIGKSINKPKDDNHTDDGKYQSVIDFPNFLLHVLKVREKEAEKEKISLDDESLLTAFESLKDADAVKRFAMNLLKCRLLFDYYVIKQDNRKANDGTDVKWAILQPKLSNNSIYAKNTFQTDKGGASEYNEHLVMVQAMFHVSHSSRIYKTWLQDVLAYLWKNRTQTKDEDFDKKFLDELHHLAHVAHDYYQKQQGKLSYPNVSYFMLNYVDYRLWYRWKKERTEFFGQYVESQNKDAEKLKAAFHKFVFMHRSSIEHCYPRNPEDPAAKKLEDDQLDKLNQLGNLCLVSHSENSRLSNMLPAAKCEKVIARLNSGRSTQSLSQLIMLMHETWDISAIEQYTGKLKDLIENQIEPIAQ
ncbi:DUF262 domain-containing protein [Moraxella sp. RCAD0137]|uniref:GmrSD restriction endonuclease domain-containing protein n=1 Tax=Moraxella sp. RCAD0137 TaxID=1775913 RepID=UPI000C9F492B|nr:DUF262 domain-containing protein [Moraxella sp. RCAD0137]PNP98525.1 hypothetical protein AZ602_02585 [Moraxella sp. RCAD0137]